MMDLLAIGEFEPETRALSGRPKLPLLPKIDFLPKINYESAERPPHQTILPAMRRNRPGEALSSPGTSL